MHPLTLIPVQKQLDAYNAQDLDAFLACYADDVEVVADDGRAPMVGKTAMGERYRDVFARFPDNHASLVGRLYVGPYVIDSEMVMGRGDAPLLVIAKYTVIDGLIRRVEFLTEHPVAV
jgi:hypothetical protein